MSVPRSSSNPSKIRDECITVYLNQSTPQLLFAAEDIRSALEKTKACPVHLQDISDYSENSKKPSVVITKIGDARTIELMKQQAAITFPELGKESYFVTSSGEGNGSHWVIGGDVNGAMYGALLLAENILFDGPDTVLNEQGQPFLETRGIKFNIPLDLQSPTYFEGHHGTANMLAIKDVWELDFWTSWFDEMARHRFNTLTLWSPHPFTSMINMEQDYPGIAIQGVQGFDKGANIIPINDKSIAEKIEFWRSVMKYGRDRGFSIYLINWNVFLSSAEGKHGLTSCPTNQKTKAYLKQCMIQLLETYPDLAGFGLTVGERLPGLDKEQKEEWAWDTFGSGMMEYAIANPGRELKFIHRQHDGEIEPILKHFSQLNDLPNVKLELSCKYSEAHAHSTVTPSRWHDTGMEEALSKSGITSWLTIRNDDFHFLHWAEPQFVRDYIQGFPQPGKLVTGFNIGADGWVHTREFVSRNSFFENERKLAIERTWLMQKIWGRLSYNPSLPDAFFKNHLTLKFPEVETDVLYEAWTSSSGAIRRANEQVTGLWRFDNDFWIERWTGDTWRGGRNRHFTVEDTKEATPASGSPLQSFNETATQDSDQGVPAWRTIEQVSQLADKALQLIDSLGPYHDCELQLTIEDIRAQAYLGFYCAEKFKAVLFSLRDDQKKSLHAMGQAYRYWELYTATMDKLYRPVAMQRNKSFDRWNDDLNSVLADYHKLGGEGLPAPLN